MAKDAHGHGSDGRGASSIAARITAGRQTALLGHSAQSPRWDNGYVGSRIASLGAALAGQPAAHQTGVAAVPSAMDRAKDEIGRAFSGSVANDPNIKRMR